MDAIREIVERLLLDSNALAVGLRSPTHAMTAGDGSILSALSGPDLLDRESERTFTGKETSAHMSRVTEDATLIVVFDIRSSLGLVRLRVKKAIEDLQKAISSNQGGSTPAPAALAASVPKLKADG